MTRTEEQVIRIGQNDFGVEVIGEFTGRETFDGPLSSNRHEDGGFDCAVSGMQQTSACAGVRTRGLNFEAKSRYQAFIVADDEKVLVGVSATSPGLSGAREETLAQPYVEPASPLAEISLRLR